MGIGRREFLAGAGAAIASSAMARPIKSSLGGRLEYKVGENLPYDAVEYLESSGTQWILAVAGTVDNDFGLWAEYSMDSESDNYPAGFSYTNNARFLAPGARTYNGAWSYGWHTYSTTVTRPRYAFSDYPAGRDYFHVVKMNWKNSGKVSMDNSGDSNITGYGGVFTNKDFRLFRSISNAIKGKFKFAKISKGLEVIRDLVPVRFTNEQGLREGAMYDRVTGGLFRNQGTGSFIIGPDIS